MTKQLATLSLALPLLAFFLFGNLDNLSYSPLSTCFISSFSTTKVIAVLLAWIVSMVLIYSVNNTCLKRTGRMFINETLMKQGARIRLLKL